MKALGVVKVEVAALALPGFMHVGHGPVIVLWPGMTRCTSLPVTWDGVVCELNGPWRLGGRSTQQSGFRAEEGITLERQEGN